MTIDLEIFFGGSEVNQGRACKAGRRVEGQRAEPPSEARKVLKVF